MIRNKLLAGLVGVALTAATAERSLGQAPVLTAAPTGQVVQPAFPPNPSPVIPNGVPQGIPQGVQPGAFGPIVGSPGVMPNAMPAPNFGGGFQEPMPIGGGGPGAQIGMQPPPMPPYAWPTFAPYNNYSRVAYPIYYPYDAWPHIGPMYPFPRVPLGWRSVNLTWQDGHWWYHRTATGHDWWRIRYW